MSVSNSPHFLSLQLYLRNDRRRVISSSCCIDATLAKPSSLVPSKLAISSSTCALATGCTATAADNLAVCSRLWTSCLSASMVASSAGAPPPVNCAPDADAFIMASLRRSASATSWPSVVSSRTNSMRWRITFSACTVDMCERPSRIDWRSRVSCVLSSPSHFRMRRRRSLAVSRMSSRRSVWGRDMMYSETENDGHR